MPRAKRTAKPEGKKLVDELAAGKAMENILRA
jgi:hypothetical protein